MTVWKNTRQQDDEIALENKHTCKSCSPLSYISFFQVVVSLELSFDYLQTQERLIRRRLAEAYNMGMINPDGLMHGPYVHIVQNDGPQFVSENPDSPPHYSIVSKSYR